VQMPTKNWDVSSMTPTCCALLHRVKMHVLVRNENEKEFFV
jgi:hypothetical protein